MGVLLGKGGLRLNVSVLRETCLVDPDPRILVWWTQTPESWFGGPRTQNLSFGDPEPRILVWLTQTPESWFWGPRTQNLSLGDPEPKILVWLTQPPESWIGGPRPQNLGQNPESWFDVDPNPRIFVWGTQPPESWIGGLRTQSPGLVDPDPRILVWWCSRWVLCLQRCDGFFPTCYNHFFIIFICFISM